MKKVVSSTTSEDDSLSFQERSSWKDFIGKVDGVEEDDEVGSQGNFSDGTSHKIFEEKGSFVLDEASMERGVLAMEK